MQAVTQPTLISDLFNTKENQITRVSKIIFLVATGCFLLTISSKASYNINAVPYTMQTAVLFIIAFAYGSKLATATVISYLTMGAAGMPVFADTPAKGIGWAYMTGTTGGYLLGFIFCVFIVGQLAERGWDRHPLTAASAMMLGNLAIYVPGVIWLGTLIGWDKPVLGLGMATFIPGDLLKIGLVSILLPSMWKVKEYLDR